MFMTEAKILPGLPNISIQTTAMLVCLLVTNKDARATFWRRSVQRVATMETSRLFARQVL